MTMMIILQTGDRLEPAILLADECDRIRVALAGRDDIVELRMSEGGCWDGDGHQMLVACAAFYREDMATQNCFEWLLPETETRSGSDHDREFDPSGRQLQATTPSLHQLGDSFAGSVVSDELDLTPAQRPVLSCAKNTIVEFSQTADCAATPSISLRR
jgi:hypothetical protein